MTTPHIPPEEAFDQWLDALVDDEHRPSTDANSEVATFLQRHFALPPADVSASEPNQHEMSTNRAGNRPAPAAGSPKQLGIVPMGGASGGWHIASLASAAVLVLLALGLVGTLLRMGSDDHHVGVSATASILPFAPSPALASPTPAATCATSDTPLLTPAEPVAPRSFADLPFPIAWHEDGTITVARTGEVLREIGIGDLSILRPTPSPSVILAASDLTLDGGGRGAFVNIATGDTIEIGAYQRLVFSQGPYAFWVSDETHTRWHVIDLRSFETADLSEMFDIGPPRAWMPHVGPAATWRSRPTAGWRHGWRPPTPTVSAR